MDVQCERCKTEYEFDDALVSGRGTTVRCTNCGHQFKVRRPEGEGAGGEVPQDRWVVRTAAGSELTFLTLRELQRAILVHQVGRADMLLRGSQPRALGSIAELEPFFEGRTSSRPPPAETSKVSDISALKRNAGWGAVAPGAPSLPPPRQKVDTLRPPLSAGAAPPPPLAMAPTFSASSSLAAVPPPSHAAPPAAVPVYAPPAPAPAPFETPTPGASVPPYTPDPPVSPLARSMPTEQAHSLPPPTGVRRSMDSYDGLGEPPSVFPGSSDEPYSMPRRRRVGGWVVAAALLGAVGMVGWMVAKPYLATRAEAPPAQLDPRAQGLLADGEKALGEGSLDAAQEDFDKASALAEHDRRVLMDEARVAAAKADVPWLKLRLLPADAREEARTTSSQLDDLLVRVRKASEDALSVAPEDPSAFRVKIDALRLTGDRDAARPLVAKVISQASQPETAYVLAALDLSDPDPLWATVIDRLKVAAAAEGSAGRARAALVYALARSGDLAGAKAELAKLDAQVRPYPLLPNLHQLVDHQAPAKAAPEPRATAVAITTLPQKGIVAPGGVARGAPAGGGEVEGEGGGLGAAASAIKKGDWSRAKQIYEGLVSRNPADSEALSGLGDVARAQGDTGGAIAHYRRALSVNPSYLPALLGVADTEWASGDRGSAQRAYKDIADRFPEGTYPGYVKARSEPAAPPQSAEPVETAPPPADSARPGNVGNE